MSSKITNIFDELPDLAPTLLELRDELDRYLATDVEDVSDGLMWWYERRATFPGLSRMGRDYLSIPGEDFRLVRISFILLLMFILATTVDVERTFSQGRIVLSHIRNRLSSQSTRALMCVGAWSRLGLVKNNDILDVLGEEVKEENELPQGWDAIHTL